MKCSCLESRSCAVAPLGELFWRLHHVLPAGWSAQQPPPENRNKQMRIDVYAKIVIIMKKSSSCLLCGSWSSVGPGSAGSALRRRWRYSGGALQLRPLAALQQLHLCRCQKNIGNNQLYWKLGCVAVRVQLLGWGCVAVQARVEVCRGSGEPEDGD